MTSIGGVLKAHCKCPAGIDGRCNFVASVLFDFEQHFKYRQKCSVDADESWTSKPCKWSVPKKCKGPVKPISNEIWKSCWMDTYSSSRSQQFVRTHCLTYQCHQISADYGRNRRANYTKGLHRNGYCQQLSGENRGQVIRSYFASRAIENRSWCICSIGETIEVGHEGKVFHISCGQRKACDVLK